MVVVGCCMLFVACLKSRITYYGVLMFVVDNAVVRCLCVCGSMHCFVLC